MHATDNTGRTNPDCPAVRHGTMAARTFHHCRCPQALAACAAYEKRRILDQVAGHRRTHPAAGTIRRIRALYAIGWPAAHLADELGISTSRLANLARQRTVHAGTAGRVRELYDRLSGTAGPSDRLAQRSLAWGYVPPIGWDDDTIDNPDAQPWAVLCDDNRVRHGQQLARPPARPQAHTPAQRAIRDERRNARKAAARARAAADLEARVDAYIGAAS